MRCQLTILSKEMCRDCNSGERLELFNMNFKELGWEKKTGYPGPKLSAGIRTSGPPKALVTLFLNVFKVTVT